MVFGIWSKLELGISKIYKVFERVVLVKAVIGWCKEEKGFDFYKGLGVGFSIFFSGG